MSTNRATWFFNDRRTSKGWSITLWDTNNGASLANTGDKAFDVAKLMVKMLAPDILLDYIRVSNDEVVGDSEVFFGVIPPTQLQGFVYNKDFAASLHPPAELCFNVRMEAGDNYRGPIYLSGAPADEYSDYITNRSLSSEWEAAFNGWWKAISTGGKFPFGIKVLPKKGDGIVETAVTNIVFTAQNNIVVTSPAHGLQNGNPVRINKVVVASGRFSVSDVPVIRIDNDNFKIVTYTRTLPGEYIGGGFVKKLVPLIVPISRAVIRGTTTRKRGRPFGLRPGKVKKAG